MPLQKRNQMVFVSPQCHPPSFMEVEATRRDKHHNFDFAGKDLVVRWLSQDGTACGAEPRLQAKMSDTSSQALLLHTWRAAWVWVGQRGKGWTLGSCCWARAVSPSPSLGVQSRGRSKPCGQYDDLLLCIFYYAFLKFIQCDTSIILRYL